MGHGQIPCIDSSPRADRHNPVVSRVGSKIAVRAPAATYHIGIVLGEPESFHS